MGSRVIINKDKFKAFLSNKSISQADASLKMGKGKNFLSSALHHGSLSLEDAKLFEEVTGAERSNYSVGRKVTRQKGRGNEMIQINSNNLRTEIEKRGLVATELSEELGKNRHYITASLNNGVISRTIAILLDKMYNIKLEDYQFKNKEEEKVIDEEKKEDSESTSVFNIDYEKLAGIIESAVYSAVKKAWSE